MLKTHIWAAGVSLAVGTAVIVLVRVDRTAPIDMTGIYTLQSEVRQGDKIDVLYGYTVRRKCDSSMVIAMFDKTEQIRRYETPLDESVGTPGDIGPEVYTGMLKKIGIPVQSDTGLARVDIEVKSVCRFWHNWWPLTTKVRSLNFVIQPVALVEPEAIVPPQAVEELKQEVKELKEKVGSEHGTTEPGPTGPGPIETQSAPEGQVAPQAAPQTPAADEYKPKPIEKTKTKKRKKKQVRDDDPGPEVETEPETQSRTQQNSVKPQPKKDEDTPAWFNKLLNDVK